MKVAHRWWLLFGAGTLTVLAAMAWISVVLVGLDRAERTARVEASYQESVRLALWRMDSWLAPRLAPEAGRPFFEYVPYYAQERAYTRMLSAIEPGEVLTPSPLLTFADEFFLLHFQVDAAGHVTSPQVPEGNLRDLAEATVGDASRLHLCRDRLDEVTRLVDGVPTLRPRVLALEQCVAMPQVTTEPDLPTPPAEYKASQTQQREMTKAEWTRRAQNTGQVTVAGAEMLNRLQSVQTDAGGVRLAVGPLVPIWIDEDGETPRLLYLRRVQIGAEELLQGLLVDWPRLHEALLAQISDLFEEARLVPTSLLTLTTDPAPTALTTLPASLAATRSPGALAASGPTPLRLTLTITWAVVLLAVIAAALSLRASIAYGERRSRFASAVTHELRTPLTTFRMYSEMLADDMVSDPADRKSYLETLKVESQRLATLVENVLAYARLERGRGVGERRRLPAKDLLERVVPDLERRAAAAGLTLQRSGSVPDEVQVETDPEAVGQILFNLVDNACKYGGDRPLELETETQNGSVLVRVRDHGPGVPAAEASAIFRPFARGRDNGRSNAPGIGLGLALSRGLARDLGGDLRLVPSDGGACFELEVPLGRD